ncbi:hypothetical protein [Actinomadura hibisca]|uniref:hypothetical protein n=1 Tax=Actinomadura hibisca TaxID=68565 RepID=UPI00083398A2|nr:hypothetical protein [Actinomadura hibisca]
MTVPVPDPVLITAGVLAAPTAWALWRARRLRRSRPVPLPRVVWSIADQRWLLRNGISPVNVEAAAAMTEDGGRRRRRGGTV